MTDTKQLSGFYFFAILKADLNENTHLYLKQSLGPKTLLMKILTSIEILVTAICLPTLLVSQQSFSKEYIIDTNTSSSDVSIAELANGNFVVGGVGVQNCIFKWLDADGDPISAKNYNSFPQNDSLQVNYVNKIVALPDNGVIVFGFSLFYHINENRLFLIRLDAQGNKQWDISLGNSRVGSTSLNNLMRVSDGSFVVSYISPNDSFPDIVLVKINAQGQLLWSKKFDSGGPDYIVNIAETTGGDLIIGAEEYLFKTNASGNLLWSKSYDGWFSSLQSFSNGDILSNYRYDKTNQRNFSTIRFDPQGNVMWAKKIGNLGSYISWLIDPIVTPADNIYVVLAQSTFAKLDGNGNMEWSRNYSNGTYPYSMTGTNDDGLAMLGTSYYPVNFNSVIKTDADGNVDGCNHFPTCFQLEDFTLQSTGAGQFTITDYPIDTALEGSLQPLTFTAEDYCTPGELPKPEFTTPDTLCVGDCFTPGYLQQRFADDWYWKMEGCLPDVSNEQAPSSFCTIIPGTFKLTQYVFYGGCVDSFSTSLTVMPPPYIELGNDTLLCEGQDFILDATGALHASLVWEDGSTAPIRTVTSPGTYSLTISDSYCEASDTIAIRFFEKLFPKSFDLGPDTVICLGSSIFLTGDLSGIDDYIWEDGTTGPTRLINSPGIYQLTGIYETCTLKDAIVISYRNCEGKLYLPNAFSPNNDGINDSFELFGLDIQMDELKVFDRWGGLVFETKSPFTAWNGMVRGKPANAGTYTYCLRTTNLLSGKKEVIVGEVQLLR